MHAHTYGTTHVHRHLAWHETLELHEFIAFQANAWTKMKKSVRKVDCLVLKSIDANTIEGLEANLRELLSFNP